MAIFDAPLPNGNDGMQRAVFDNGEFYLRFTYNDTFDYWLFGIYDNEKRPLVQMQKIVKDFPLNKFYERRLDLPQGLFIATCSKDRIGHDDFKNGSAGFFFVTGD